MRDDPRALAEYSASTWGGSVGGGGAMSPLPPAALWAQLIIAITVAVVGVYISWMQMRIAAIKVQHELYPDRLKVYQTAADFVAKIQRDGTATNSDINTFNSRILDSEFLFDAEFVALLRDIHKHATYLHAYSVEAKRGVVTALDGETKEKAWLEKARRRLQSEAKPFIQFPSPRTNFSRIVRFMDRVFS